jgi:ABC-type lipoprotein export system ATPase subunit
MNMSELPAEATPLVELRGVCKTYAPAGEPVHALRGIDLSLHRRERVAVVGPSGCGKSTLMNILGLLDRPSAGTHCFEGRDIDESSVEHMAFMRNRCIGFVFQQFHLLDTLSAESNVELPLLYGGVSAVERKRRTQHYLGAVGLGHRRSHRPMELSGGERQRVAIARALASEPRLLLADEPTGALDSTTGQTVLDLMLGLCDEHAITLVVVTHDMGVAAQLDRRIALRDGRIESDAR